MDKHPQRKLSAILFADVSNYTATMQQDEDLARGYIRIFREVIEEKVAANQGQVLNFYGDGCICVFESSVVALECAAEAQMSFIEQAVPVRMGLHSGDVYFEDGTVYGDSVNIASRIESMGVPGSVLFSERVKRDITNHPELQHSSIGRYDFKNIYVAHEVFALTSEGMIVPTEASATAKLKESAPANKVFKFGIKEAVFGLLLLAIILVVSNWDDINDKLSTTKDSLDVGTIAILDFENHSGKEEHDILAKMLTNRVVHGVTSNDLARVVTDEVINDYQSIMTSSVVPSSRNDFLSNEMNVTEIIQGSIYTVGDEIIVECTVANAKTGEIVRGLPSVKGPADDPARVIDDVRQIVLGYLAASSDRDLNLFLDQRPPKYDAYRELLMAKAADLNNDSIELHHLQKAIAIDPDYFEPRVMLIAYYYNLREYATADSVFSTLHTVNKQSEPRQANLLYFYEALLNGQNHLIYKFLKSEYDQAPFDLTTNQSLMVIALQFTNQMDEAIEIYDVIPEDKLDYATCDKCRIRLYLKAYIDIEYNEYDDAINLCNILLNNNGEYWARDMLIRAYARSGRWDELDAFLARRVDSETENYVSDYLLLAGIESFNAGSSAQAGKYLDELKALSPGKWYLEKGIAYYLSNEYQQATEAFTVAIQKDSTNRTALSYLAAIALERDDLILANRYLDQIEALTGEYDYGQTRYYQARSYALAGNYPKALTLLEASVADGYWNDFSHFHHDVAFQDIKDSDEFVAIRDYWKEK